MLAIKGYSNGKYVIPYGNKEIPKNKTVILTFLEDEENDNKDKTIKWFNNLCNKLKEDATVLDEKYDKVLSDRVKIERKLDL